MTVAKNIGLTPVSTWVETMGDSAVFVAERYDRVVTGAQTVRDFIRKTCVRPWAFARLGSTRSADLRNGWPACCASKARPAEEVRKLFRQVAFRVVMGDADGHGKNYSVCLDDGKVTMSPIYDCCARWRIPSCRPRWGLRSVASNPRVESIVRPCSKRRRRWASRRRSRRDPGRTGQRHRAGSRAVAVRSDRRLGPRQGGRNDHRTYRPASGRRSARRERSGPRKRQATLDELSR